MASGSELKETENRRVGDAICYQWREETKKNALIVEFGFAVTFRAPLYELSRKLMKGRPSKHIISSPVYPLVSTSSADLF